ncbi:MAG: hypothetical protein ABEJ40_07535 [Haloarculaceae archaeon]
MWPTSGPGAGETVTCIACGETVARSEAREYDKYGDRWERRDKEFEYLCKPCDRERCHQPRGDLEAVLEDAEDACDGGRDAFVREYTALVDPPDESAGSQ